MRRKIVAGNWKMNNSLKESTGLVKEIIKKNNSYNCEVYVAPAFPFLNDVSVISNSSQIKVLAQNVSSKSNGAFTGEVSVDMLKSINIKSVIIGHSERRMLFGEDDKTLKMKLENCFKNDMEVFFCIGETLDMREKRMQNEVIENQLKNTLFDLDNVNLEKLIIAYEPVWAIGTGVNANSDQVQEIHCHIRKLLNFQYGKESSDLIPIIYGGSLKPDNSSNIFNCSDVDGGLVGGASLNSETFIKIIDSI